jgi:D-sedoheptulose 7-phosphate isomerase
MQNILAESFKEAAQLISLFCENSENLLILEMLSRKFAEAFLDNKKILICGNGGSACDAMHFAEEFTGRYRQDRRALPVIHLGDSGHVTCVANDYGYEAVFARGVEAYGKRGDWLIGLSTSGNSKNVIQAFKKAKIQGLNTFALLGKEGGLIKGFCDYELIIPGKTADRIQEVHMTILHILIEGVERVLFPENYSETVVKNELVI